MHRDLLSQTSSNAIILTLIIFCANSPWFLWTGGLQISFLLTIYLFCKNFKLIQKHLSSLAKLVIFFFLIPTFVLLPLFRGWHLTGIIFIISFIIGVTFPINQLQEAFRLITRVLAVIIIFSLPLWLIHVFIFQFPPITSINLGSMKGDFGDVNMKIYGFFVTNDGFGEVFRFYSVFDEPGVLGTLSACILYGNKYNFHRWENIVIFIGSFFTYSMAFYVLTFIGFFIVNIKKPSILIKSLIIIIPIISIGFYILRDDIAFQQAVMYRLFDSDMGSNLDNRTEEITNKAYNNLFSNDEWLFGIGNNSIVAEKMIASTSYKGFILEYGIIGIISLFFMYIVMMRNKANWYCWGALLLFFLSFLQRPQLWTGKQIILFCSVIAALPSIKSSDRIKTKIISEE